MSIEACRQALWQYKPGHKLSVEEQMAFDGGWNAAMKFMVSPRIPAPAITLTPTQKGPDVIAERFVDDAKRTEWLIGTPEAKGIVCRICGGHDAQIREGELETAAISGRAHVDCFGHGMYRPITTAEWDISDLFHRKERAKKEAPPKEHNPHGLVAFYTDAPNV